MNWDPRKLGSIPEWVIAIVAVLTLFRKLKIYSRLDWVGAAIVGGILLVIILILKTEIYPQIASRVPRIKQIVSKVPENLAKAAGFIFSLFTKIVVVGIVSLGTSFVYTDYLSSALGKVIYRKGSQIAEKAENCIRECVRENDEKIILTLVDSEEVHNKICRDALEQAKRKTYIDFIDGRYQTRRDWIMLRCTLTGVNAGSGERLLLTLTELTEEERRIIGDAEEVLVLVAEVLQHLQRAEGGRILEERRRLLNELESGKSILLTEGEREAITDCFNKHEEKDDLYSLMYSVLSDPKVITELKREEAYDVKYYELRERRKGDRLKEGEEIVRLFDSPVVIKKAVRHFTPYDKLGIIGCYIDELRFQLTKSKNQLPKS